MDNLTISREMDEQLYTALASSTEITGGYSFKIYLLRLISTGTETNFLF